jgi:photosystem II stability/assembly factor-like uncharacterized protein
MKIRHSLLQRFVVYLCLLLCLQFASARNSFSLTRSSHEAAQQPQQKSDAKPPEELKGLKFRLLGPAWGGRASRAAGVPGDPSIYYAASASGGVWKSTDAGLTWKPIFDKQPISSIGSIAVSPSDPNVIYVGSGEANIRGNVAAGNGIYKSLDAGKTWTHVWKQEGQIGTLVVHPRDPNIAFAAVLGHAFGPNPQRGVYRTKDGGKTWEQVLKKDENTGASDVVMDPSNPNILFAGLWQARRFPWDLESGGPGSGLYVSRDGGDTWQQLKEKGLPAGIWGKVGVAVAPSDGRRVYALIEAQEGGLFRSDDGGETWTRASANRLLRQRPWYYSTITVNPANPDEVWCPQVPMLKSIDGGKNFNIVKGIAHGDNHDLWIDPKNPKRMIGADDGGLNVSVDGGETWYQPAIPLGQFYHVSVDNRVPFHVAGAMQDIGTAQGPSNSLRSTGIRNTDWYGVGGGEAGWVVSDPADPNIVYAGEYGGYISRYDHRTRQARNVSVYPEDPSGHGAEDMTYRFQWTAPIAVSPHNPRVMYHGANVLFKTEDGGQTWSQISPDLTRNDKSKQKWAGGPITGDNTGVETYCTIFVVAESPVEKGLIWTGSDDGLVHIKREGKDWKNVTAGMNGLPEWGTISMIEPSRTEAGSAWVVVDAHRLDDMHPYLFKTTDYGSTWSRLDSSLPQDVYLHSVRVDTEQSNILYLGTERGVMYSTDGGGSWKTLKLNFPTVAVHDLVVKGDSLVLATHGRSIWTFDHLSVIREMTDKIRESSLHFFSAPAAIRWRFHGGPSDKWSGENPPARATFYYWLKEAPKGEVSVEVIDLQGHVVRTLSSKPATPPGSGDDMAEAEESAKKAALPKEAGMNAGTWDLAYSGAELIQDAKLDAGNPTVGPLAPPGTYTLKLTVDGMTASTQIKVEPDPRVKVSEADLLAQFAESISIRDAITRLTKDVRQLRSVRQQLVSRNELLKGIPAAAQLTKDSTSLAAKLEELESKFQNPKAEVVYDILAFKGGAKLYSRMSSLYDATTDSDGEVTQGVRDVFAEQKKELEGYEAELKKLLESDLVSLNAMAKRLELPTILAGMPN